MKRGTIHWGEPVDSDHLLHLTLTWAARGLLTMTDDWRHRRVLLFGQRASNEVELAADALYTQRLVFVMQPGLLVLPGSIGITAAGKDKLAEWDALTAGVERENG